MWNLKRGIRKAEEDIGYISLIEEFKTSSFLEI